jgi:hypothetical protein
MLLWPSSSNLVLPLFQSKRFGFKTIGNLIAELMGDFYHPLYLRNKKYRNVDAEQVLSNKVEKMASVASFVGMMRDDAEIGKWQH